MVWKGVCGFHNRLKDDPLRRHKCGDNAGVCVWGGAVVKWAELALR